MWKAFHHPDISLPVVRRRIGTELLEMLDLFGDVAAHGGWAFLQNRSYPDKTAYNHAVSRLSRQGLIIKNRGLKTPLLKISDAGSKLLADYLRPDKWWNRKWNGIWYLLVYDVPEADRSYRNVLRKFLQKQRMGCFQKSVWISAHDMRPQYADLARAAAVDSFACLFEAHTVLGMPAEKVVRESWDFDQLYVTQKRYCDVYSENLSLLRKTICPDMNTLMRLAAEEIDAYRCAFVQDPLLPGALLPHTYQGQTVLNLHKQLVSELRRQIVLCNPE